MYGVTRTFLRLHPQAHVEIKIVMMRFAETTGLLYSLSRLNTYVESRKDHQILHGT